MEQARTYLFDLFEKYKLQAGYYIDSKWLMLGYNNANIVVQKHFYEALEQMGNDGFFENKEGHGDKLFLTQKGEDALINYINERNNTTMNSKLPNISVNVNPTFTQTNNQTASPIMTQTSTLTVNVEEILRNNGLSEKDLTEVREIAQAAIPPQEKKNKLIDFLGNLSSKVVSGLLSEFIINLF